MSCYRYNNTIYQVDTCPVGNFTCAVQSLHSKRNKKQRGKAISPGSYGIAISTSLFLFILFVRDYFFHRFHVFYYFLSVLKHISIFIVHFVLAEHSYTRCGPCIPPLLVYKSLHQRLQRLIAELQFFTCHPFQKLQRFYLYLFHTD